MNASSVLRILAACACLACAMPASATLITSRAALGGTDFIDWGQLSDALFFVDEPANVVTHDGLQAVATGSGSGFERDDNGLGFAGDFARGDHLLVTVGAPTIRILFPDARLTAIGAQIEDSGLDFPFLATISAFDVVGNLLESYSLGGIALSRRDNSALFLGIARDTADIASVVFGTNTGRAFAINQTDLAVGRPSEPPPTTSVPEPGVLALAALAVGLLALSSRRRWLSQDSV